MENPFFDMNRGEGGTICIRYSMECTESNSRLE